MVTREEVKEQMVEIGDAIKEYTYHKIIIKRKRKKSESIVY